MRRHISHHLPKDKGSPLKQNLRFRSSSKELPLCTKPYKLSRIVLCSFEGHSLPCKLHKDVQLNLGIFCMPVVRLLSQDRISHQVFTSNGRSS